MICMIFYMIWVSDECQHGDAIPVSQQTRYKGENIQNQMSTREIRYRYLAISPPTAAPVPALALDSFPALYPSMAPALAALNDSILYWCHHHIWYCTI